VSIRAEGERIAQLLGLERLPGEGGLFRRTHADAHSSVIYFMLLTPDFSALHTLHGKHSARGLTWVEPMPVAC
jgi:hypothetical protein